MFEQHGPCKVTLLYSVLLRMNVFQCSYLNRKLDLKKKKMLKHSSPSAKADRS